MAVIAELTEEFEGGTIGTAITTGNSVFASITGTTVTPPTFVADPYIGTRSGRVQTAATTSSLRADFTGVATLWFNFYFKVITAPGAITAVANWFSGANKVGDLRIAAVAGGVEFQLRDNSTVRWTSATVLPLDTWCRVAVRAVPLTATGHRAKLYTGANLATMTVTEDSGDLTCSAQTLATTMTSVRLGCISAETMDLRYDRIRGDNASEPTGSGGVGSPIVVDAGVNQVDVEPYAVATLSALASGGAGTGYTYTWTQTAGTPTVTLAGSGSSRTFTAPATMAGTALTFQVEAGDGTSTEVDSVVVTVDPHNFWTRVAAAWEPCAIRVRTGGTWGPAT